MLLRTLKLLSFLSTIIGWLCKEIKAAIPNGGIVTEGPRVYGGMTLPVELIMVEIYDSLGIEHDIKL
jgi:pyruvate ferredoxin oxidoreductase alpha subunit